MATVPTAQQMLDAIRLARLRLATAGERVKLPDGTEITSASLADLDAMEARYQAEINGVIPSEITVVPQGMWRPV